MKPRVARATLAALITIAASTTPTSSLAAVDFLKETSRNERMTPRALNILTATDVWDRDDGAGAYQIGLTTESSTRPSPATSPPAATTKSPGSGGQGSSGGSRSGASPAGPTTRPRNNRTAPAGQAAIPNGQVATVGFRYTPWSTPEQILAEWGYQSELLRRRYPNAQGARYEQDAAFVHGKAIGQYGLAVLRQAGLFPTPQNPTDAPRPAFVTTAPAEVWDAITTWSHESQVATPRPHVQAGRAIPGLLTYLETGLTLSTNEVIASPVGPLAINGTATLTIDWGDGEISTGITNPGGPYPDGQLTHHYPNSGDYNITVTANWIINYDLAGNVGVIPLTTTGVLPNFPVRALRAVARPVHQTQN